MAILYYLVLKPLSLLPLAVLYRLSDLIYVVLYYVVGYRRGVVSDNIATTLTHLSDEEMRGVERGFYKHFCDVMIESIRLFSMPESEARRRVEIEDAEILRELYVQGSSVLAVGGHYGNWELFGTTTAFASAYTCYGIYTPIRQPFIARRFLESRSRFGVTLVPKKEVKDFFASPPDHPYIMYFGSDQSPSIGRSAYEMTFLGRPSRVQYGLEKYAMITDVPVVYFEMTKKRRGYYSIRYELIAERPCATTYGEITKAYTRAIEASIMAEPQYWLWSHRRWKGMDTPDDVAS